MDERKSGFNQFFDIVEEAVDARTAFRSALVRHLYDWWIGASRDGLPRHEDFDIVEHGQIVANVFVTDCRPDGNFVFRLLGEEVIHIIGRNRTGDIVTSGAVGEYGHALFEYYTDIARTRRCMKCLGSLKFAGKDFARFESIDCPLSDDGVRVSRIIGVMDLL